MMKHHSMKVRDANINSMVILRRQFLTVRYPNLSLQLGFNRNKRDTMKAMTVTVEMIAMAAFFKTVCGLSIAMVKDAVAAKEETKR